MALRARGRAGGWAGLSSRLCPAARKGEALRDSGASAERSGPCDGDLGAKGESPGEGRRRRRGRKGSEGITWRNARIISSATEGGRTHCSSSARRRRREAARAGVSDSSPKPAGCEEAALRRGGERWAPGGRGAQGITPTHAGLAPRDQVAGKMPIARRSLKGRGGPGTVSRS